MTRPTSHDRDQPQPDESPHALASPSLRLYTDRDEGRLPATDGPRPPTDAPDETSPRVEPAGPPTDGGAAGEPDHDHDHDQAETEPGPDPIDPLDRISDQCRRVLDLLSLLADPHGVVRHPNGDLLDRLGWRSHSSLRRHLMVLEAAGAITRRTCPITLHRTVVLTTVRGGARGGSARGERAGSARGERAGSARGERAGGARSPSLGGGGDVAHASGGAPDYTTLHDISRVSVSDAGEPPPFEAGRLAEARALLETLGLAFRGIRLVEGVPTLTEGFTPPHRRDEIAAALPGWRAELVRLRDELAYLVARPEPHHTPPLSHPASRPQPELPLEPAWDHDWLAREADSLHAGGVRHPQRAERLRSLTDAVFGRLREPKAITRDLIERIWDRVSSRDLLPGEVCELVLRVADLGVGNRARTFAEVGAELLVTARNRRRSATHSRPTTPGKRRQPRPDQPPTPTPPERPT